MSEWGRVDDEGTVYVKTADGERAVGSWKAGAPQEGLVHFIRRFEQLATEVVLLEQRLNSGAGDPTQVAQSAERLKGSLPAAAAVGNLDALVRRVDVLLEKTAAAVEVHKAARAEAKVKALEAKAALADEADRLGGSSEWKTTGERLRILGDDWKRLPHGERKAEDELWSRITAARKRFTERRTTHFAALATQREVSQERKEQLIKEAEKLSSSTDWKDTADRYKQLMSDWKTAGRAPREVEDELWARFKAAQDVFFTGRNTTFSAQDEELRGNQTVKEALLTEIEALDVSGGTEAAGKRLRALQDKWEVAGKVPRDAMRSLEDRMQKAEERIRGAATARVTRAPESLFAAQLRARVGELEDKLARAQAAGRPIADLEDQLKVQREWLAQAGSSAGGSPKPDGSTAGAGGGNPKEAKREKPRTTAWVRADS